MVLPILEEKEKYSLVEKNILKDFNVKLVLFQWYLNLNLCKHQTEYTFSTLGNLTLIVKSK